MKKEPSVSLHRAADVADRDERPRFTPRLAMRPFQDLAPMTEARSQSAPQVKSVLSSLPLPSRQLLSQRPRQIADHSLDLVDLGLGEAREVTLSQHLVGAIGLPHLEDASLLRLLLRR